MRKARLVYTAVIRPAMTYGIQAWGIGPDGKHARANVQQLEKVQNRCLRRVTGGYKRTPRAALGREAHVPPLDLYSDTVAMKRALAIRDHPVSSEIRRAAEAIWEAAGNLQQTSTRGRGRPRRVRRRPPTTMERVQQRAIEREDEMQGYNVWQADQRLRAGGRQGPGRRRRGAGSRGQQGRKPTTLIDDWADLEWKKRWQREARDREATTWRTPWEQSPLKLSSDLPKHQATALFLLRTEVIGLNAWLASIRVPNVTPQCECGWQAQTVRHVLPALPEVQE